VPNGRQKCFNALDLLLFFSLACIFRLKACRELGRRLYKPLVAAGGHCLLKAFGTAVKAMGDPLSAQVNTQRTLCCSKFSALLTVDLFRRLGKCPVLMTGRWILGQ